MQLLDWVFPGLTNWIDYSNAIGSSLTHSPEMQTEELPIPALAGKKIVVITWAANGLGDFSCGVKICDYLRQQLKISSSNIALVVRKTDRVKCEKFIPKEITLVDNDFISIDRWKPDIKIIAPVAMATDAYVFDGIPALSINEYGFKPDSSSDCYKNVHCYAMGLSKDSLGIMLHPTLREWSKTQDSEDPIKRLSQLKAVPRNLQKAILGGEFSEERVYDFSKRSKLYFGYAHYPNVIGGFIEAVAKMNATNDSDLCFYMMGDDFRSHPEGKNQAFLPKQELDFLKKQGVGALECIDVGKDKYEKTLLDEKLKKIIRIIVGKLSTEFVPAMHMASEDESLATGDQSFSEFFPKFPAYEVYCHKKRLFAQYSDLIPENLRELFKKAHQTDDHSTFSFNVEALADFFLEKKKNAVIYKEAIQKIIDEVDFGPRFNRAMIKLLDETKDIKKLCIKPLKLTEQPSNDAVAFDQPYFMLDADVEKLELRGRISLLPQFKDSTFELNAYCCDDEYLVVRRKK